MSNYSQDEIVRRGEILSTNGLRAEAQAVLAGIGVTPAVLGEGAAKVAALKTAREAKLIASTAKKNATASERAARKAAERELVNFAETSRILFKDDPITLAHLNLQVHYETVKDPETGEESRQAVRPSKATAETIGRWHTSLSGAQSLDAANKAILAGAAWSAARVTAALALVEAYASADTAQRVAIQAFEQASGTLIAAFDELSGWYTRTRKLCLIAIKGADPNNTQNLAESLGL